MAEGLPGGAPPWGAGQGFHVVLVHPEIPPNTGNIGRLCVGTGCHLHLIEPLGFDLSEKAVRRAGLDYWKDVALRVYPSVEAFFAEHRRPGARFFLMSARRGIPYTSASYQAGDYLVFGRESTGLPEEIWADPPGEALRIPIGPAIRSLNLSNAVAVVVFEGLRQLHREHFPGP